MHAVGRTIFMAFRRVAKITPLHPAFDQIEEFRRKGQERCCLAQCSHDQVERRLAAAGNPHHGKRSWINRNVKLTQLERAQSEPATPNGDGVDRQPCERGCVDPSYIVLVQRLWRLRIVALRCQAMNHCMAKNRRIRDGVDRSRRARGTRFLSAF